MCIDTLIQAPVDISNFQSIPCLATISVLMLHDSISFQLAWSLDMPFIIPCPLPKHEEVFNYS